MRVSVVSESETFSLELDSELTLEILRSLVADEVNDKSGGTSILLFFNGRLLTEDQKSLIDLGLTDGCVLQLEFRRQNVGRHQLQDSASLQHAPPISNTSGFRMNGHEGASANYAEAPVEPPVENEADTLLARASVERNAFCDIVEVQYPELGRALKARDRQAVIAALTDEREKRSKQREIQRQRWLRAMQNPMDPDAQAVIFEEVQQRRIEDNFLKAQEHLPESFAAVFMLYVHAEVNGVPVRAFVDSGAQNSLMTRRCAEKCGILDLLDKRFSGVARGVGQSKILGRIHLVTVQLGGRAIDCSITVLERGSISFLFGLDLLRRHRCCIDLRRNCLIVEDTQVPFLPESEVRAAEKVSAEELQEEEEEEEAGNSSSSDGDVNMKQKIERLMSLGFEKSAAQKALVDAGGNEDLAASLLLQI